MEEQFDIRDYRPSGKERDFENALRPLQFGDFSGQDKVVDNLRIFVKAARLKYHATEIAHYLKSDRKAAKKIREVVENGKMVSGYYMMAPLSNGNNRFILFSNPSKSKGTVIYIEGNLSPEDIMQLCYSRR